MPDGTPDYENYDYQSEWIGRTIEDRAERELVSAWAGSGETCVELGGGFGRLTAALEPRFAETFMIDLSKRNLSNASTTLRRARLIRTTIARIPFEDCTFDSVVAIRVLHHVQDLAIVFEEMVRVARDGACVLIGVANTTRRALTGNTLVAVGPQGHRIYAAPISAYAHPNLQTVAIGGLGLFDNGLGRRLHSFAHLSRLDVATSFAWWTKPEVFIKFRACKTGPPKKPRVICRCGTPIISERCNGCGTTFGRIIDLTEPQG